jgi:hypothetical protein
MALYVPPVRTKVSVADLVESLRRAWTARWSPPRRWSLVLLAAQWGIETADGASMWCWNIGNVKRMPGHPWTMLDNVPEIIGGKRVVFRPPHSQTHFRAFASLDDGAAAYLDILFRRFAVAWPAVVAGEATQFARALKSARYYTADEHAYADALVRRVDLIERKLDGYGLKTQAEIAAALRRLGYITSDLVGAVRAFQADHAGLAIDGVPGKYTKDAIRDAIRSQR